MASLRNATKRVAHKERGQPSTRKNAGFLEKHVDYVVRARNFQKKRDYIKILKTKAADRNPDEFYHGMQSSGVTEGVHQTNVSNNLDSDTIKLLKTQDIGYLVYKKSLDDRKIQRLQDNLHLIGQTNVYKHTIFLDRESEVDQFNPDKFFGTSAGLSSRSFNRPKTNNIDSSHLPQSDGNSESKKSYRELAERVKRSTKLGAAIDAIEIQQKLSARGSKRKIVVASSDTVQNNDGEEKNVAYKWRRRRLR